MLEQFHFTQPLWLLALIPLLLMLGLGFRSASSSKAWDKIIDPNLLPVLLQGKQSGSDRFAKSLIAMGWLIAVIALADPVWEKIPRPIFQTNAARVLVLDLSNSMLVDDLKPSRLARAKFKIEDILSMDEEGQTGLVVFAGDAFIASPLTRDAETIRSMLKVLTPQLMPAQGSRADLGLLKAHELFKQSGIMKGQVLLIADGVSKSAAAIEAVKELKNAGHAVSVLGVGTEAGGELRFRNNDNVLVKLEADKLTELAMQGGGKYHLISANNEDLSQVLIEHKMVNDTTENALQEQDINNEEWYSTGPLIVLLLLPLASLAFRRGWLLNIAFVAVSGGVLLQPQPVMAFSLDELWTTLSQNKEQRADKALKSQQYEKARDLSKEPLRRGAAEYKQGNYEEALQNFKESKGADARYNEGNSLAKLKKYEEAIKSYEKALSLNPDMTDAEQNKKAIEELLKKQQEQKQSGNESKEDSTESSEDNSQSDSESKDQKDQQNSEGEEGQKKSEQGQESSEKSQSGEDQQQQDSKEKSEKSGEDDQQKKSDKNQFSDANKALDEEQQKDEASDPDSKQADQQNQNDQNADQKGEKEGQPEDQQQDDASAEKGQEKSQQELDEQAKQKAAKQGSNETADDLTEEEKMAAEQWLRRIPDDPGGLLRRKFRSQYQQRNGNIDNSEQPW
ncbi:VWA domain-containing protein [Cocleimonas flava]|uniref:Ca-activated chloride channel family protein n=1 Tax=Cocleimonas flava TaxID=634765 RepID=A0A4R1F4S1_9GAMM|nr:VWA domain-containing protein [Cocleimonas flava]TCJ88843.1 Ca-activated chloride channel family protein [Cocleimonas flava]